MHGLAVDDQHQLIEKLTEKIESLKQRQDNLTPYEQWKIDQEEHSLECRRKMEVDYEYFKLKKENAHLTDENDELKSKYFFWKEKAQSYREDYFNLLERRCEKQ